MTIFGLMGRAAVLAGLALLCTAVQAPSASATETGGSQALYGPGGCADWGQTAVRNWLTGACRPPAGVITYRHRYNGGGGVWVRGLSNGDGCSYSPARPRGKYDFRPACDMHDYGFTLMQHGQLKKTQQNLNEINSWFVTVLRHGVCGEHRGAARTECQGIAASYLYPVQLLAGSPVAPV